MNELKAKRFQTLEEKKGSALVITLLLEKNNDRVFRVTTACER